MEFTAPNLRVSLILGSAKSALTVSYTEVNIIVTNGGRMD